MEGKTSLTKVMVITGLLLVWFPILTALLRLILADPATGVASASLLDYLRPALGPIGGGLLFWAALRSRLRLKLIGLGMVALLGSLAVRQVLARVVGVSAGELWPAGPAWIAFIVSLEVSSLALLIVALGGALLLRDLFRPPVATEVENDAA